MTARPQIDLINAVFNLGAVIDALVQSVVEEHGLTASQADLLWLLDPDVDPVPLRQLASRLRCDPSYITLLSAQLEASGLAQRASHPDDGRVRVLVLTAAGREVREHVLDAAEMRSPFHELSERQQQDLLHLVLKTLSAADRSGSAPSRGAAAG